MARLRLLVESPSRSLTSGTLSENRPFTEVSITEVALQVPRLDTDPAPPMALRSTTRTLEPKKGRKEVEGLKEGRRKEEEGRRKETGGRMKEEEGRRKEEEGRRSKKEEEGGRRKEEGGRRKYQY